MLDEDLAAPYVVSSAAGGWLSELVARQRRLPQIYSRGLEDALQPVSAPRGDSGSYLELTATVCAVVLYVLV